MEINAYSLRYGEREVWEFFSRGERLRPRFVGMMSPLEFCSHTRRFQGLFCCLGASSQACLRLLRAGSVKTRVVTNAMVVGQGAVILRLYTPPAR